jgi:hypothetical protein
VDAQSLIVSGGVYVGQCDPVGHLDGGHALGVTIDQAAATFVATDSGQFREETARKEHRGAALARMYWVDNLCACLFVAGHDVFQKFWGDQGLITLQKNSRL